MANKTYDAIIIGGGPGGYPAAIRLGQLKNTVLVVEKEYIGGVCLNWGCIPSKALIAAANFYEKAQHTAGTMGITFTDVKVDVTKLQAWKQGIVGKLTGGVRMLVKANGGEIVMGTGKLVGPNTVEVTLPDGTVERYDAKKGIVLATGATPIQIPGMEPDGEVVITAREAVSLPAVPKTLLVVGGGVIGLELGMVYQKLGAKVIVVELTDQLLPGVDVDLVKVVEKAFIKAGGEVLLKTKAAGLKRDGQTATVTVELPDGTKREITADKVLMSIGFKPNSKDLGLDAVGVKTDARGHILTNEFLRTNVPSIYAVGDVSGPPYLAHKATKEGEVCGEILAGHKAARDWRAMPAAIFTEPEVATVGLSERQVKESGREYKIGKFPFSALGRAMAVSSTDGFIKVVVDKKTNEFLGMGIVGPEAADLISEGALALEMAAFAEDIAGTIHPHPTLGEGVMEAFKHALGEAIHIANKN